MVRFTQLTRKAFIRVKPRKKSRKTALKRCPQKAGVCIAYYKEISPKKPNSGKRKVAKIRLTTGRSIRVQVNGENPELATYKRVLVQGKRVRDLPGIQYRVIRGALDVSPVLGRRTSRSKYGVKFASMTPLNAIPEVSRKKKKKK